MAFRRALPAFVLATGLVLVGGPVAAQTADTGAASTDSTITDEAPITGPVTVPVSEADDAGTGATDVVGTTVPALIAPAGSGATPVTAASSTVAPRGDNGETVVNVIILLLIAIAFGVFVLTVWFWRSTAPIPRALEPLDAMSRRSWRKRDSASRDAALERLKALDARRSAKGPAGDAGFGGSAVGDDAVVRVAPSRPDAPAAPASEGAVSPAVAPSLPAPPSPPSAPSPGAAGAPSAEEHAGSAG